MRIKKTSETRALAGTVVNTYSESQTSAYSSYYMNWKTLAEGVAGGTATALPSDFNELSIYVYKLAGSVIDPYWHLTTIILNKQLGTTDRGFELGYYGASSSNMGAIITINKSQITSVLLNVNGTQQTTTKYSVYYR